VQHGSNTDSDFVLRENDARNVVHGALVAARLNRCPYKSMVIASVAWPMKVPIVFGCSPASIQHDAAKCTAVGFLRIKLRRVAGTAADLFKIAHVRM